MLGILSVLLIAVAVSADDGRGTVWFYQNCFYTLFLQFSRRWIIKTTLKVGEVVKRILAQGFFQIKNGGKDFFKIKNRAGKE